MAAAANVLKRSGVAASSKPAIGDIFACYGTGFDDNNALTFQWSQCDTSGGTYTNITGATGQFFKVPFDSGKASVSLKGRYIKCTASGLVSAEAANALSSAIGPLGASRQSSGQGRARLAQMMKGMKGAGNFRIARGSQNTRQVRANGSA